MKHLHVLGKTYFDIPIIYENGKTGVLESDINKLPNEIIKNWEKWMFGGGYMKIYEDNIPVDSLYYINDWNMFCEVKLKQEPFRKCVGKKEIRC